MNQEGKDMTKFKFSVGPWNVHSGADSYGPATRDEIAFEEKIRTFAELGFSAIQFHDDDAVPNLKRCWTNTDWLLSLWLPGSGWTGGPRTADL